MDLDIKEGSYNLKRYVEENDKLLTALGIFSALTVFFSTGDQKTILTVTLSTVSLICTFLIWLELFSCFPSKRGSVKLVWFENMLSIGTLAFLVYVLAELNEYFPQVIGVLFGGLMLWPISVLIKKYDLFNRIFKTKQHERKYLRYIVAYIIVVLIFYFCMYVGFKIDPYASKILAGIKSEYTHEKINIFRVNEN